MEVFFMQTPMGQYLAQKEADFFRWHLQYLNRQVAVQLGGVWTRPSENMIVVPAMCGWVLKCWLLKRIPRVCY